MRLCNKLLQSQCGVTIIEGLIKVKLPAGVMGGYDAHNIVLCDWDFYSMAWLDGSQFGLEAEYPNATAIL